MTPIKSILAISLLALSLGACGGGSDVNADGGPERDDDLDGYTIGDGDCNDNNKSIHPGAPDPCDGIDQNCDGKADELFDQDDDNWTTCAGDCRDNDSTSNPGTIEVVDGFDNDCDGIIDNNTDQYDDDGDGFSEDQGDCDDDPNGDGALVGPNAVEVQLNSEGEPEGIDNDCDGEVDEAVEPCPEGLAVTDPMAFASAIDVCHEVQSATWDEANTDPRGRGVYATFGDTYVPSVGPDFAVLSSGIAGDSYHPSFAVLDPGTNLDTTIPHPDPQGAIGCSDADGMDVNDYNEVVLNIQVPTNAQAFSFDFNFMSAEFPEWVCTSFDDTFLAMLESQAFTGNISFDAMGNRVSINVGFFDVCDTTLDPLCTGDADLVGTGYEGAEGGGTGWLTTTAPVIPGEKIRLTFMVFDEGDHSWDSAVLIDNFRWELEPVDGPVTVDRKLSSDQIFGKKLKGSATKVGQ